MSSWSQCLHPLLEETLDEGTGDLICSACGTVKEERVMGVAGHRPLFSTGGSASAEGVILETPNASIMKSDIPYRMALSDACQLLGLPTATSIVQESMANFEAFCHALQLDESKTFPTKLPILAYSFQRVLADNGIFRLTHIHAGLFNITPKRLLQAENAVCEALNLSPLYIEPSLLIETVCRWLHLKPALILTCRDLCKRVESTQYGKNPEWIIYSVLHILSLRLPVIYPTTSSVICMKEVRSLLNLGTRARKIHISEEMADEELRRRSLV
jgi:hypothetical protein